MPTLVSHLRKLIVLNKMCTAKWREQKVKLKLSSFPYQHTQKFPSAYWPLCPKLCFLQCMKSPLLLRERNSSQEDQNPVSPYPAQEPCSWTNWRLTDFEPTGLCWFDIHHCTPQIKTNSRRSFWFNILDSSHLDPGKWAFHVYLQNPQSQVNMKYFPYSFGKWGTALPYFSKIKFIWNATIFLQKDRFQSTRHLTLNSMQNGLLLHTFLKSSSLHCVCR